MKTKILSAALIILAFAFAIYVLTYPPLPPKPSLSCDSENTVCMHYEAPICKLPVSVVHNMVDNYKNNQLKVINNSLDIDDAKSNWFSLETLKQFIYNIEIKAKKNKGNSLSSDDLGIRIYYASYPDRKQWSSSKYYNKFLDTSDEEVKEYPGLHTLVMIPTRKEGNLHIDFDPDNPKTYKIPLNKLEDYRKEPLDPNETFQSKIGGDLMFKFKREETSITALNHGSLFPPYSANGHGF